MQSFTNSVFPYLMKRCCGCFELLSLASIGSLCHMYIDWLLKLKRNDIRLWRISCLKWDSKTVSISHKEHNLFRDEKKGCCFVYKVAWHLTPLKISIAYLTFFYWFDNLTFEEPKKLVNSLCSGGGLMNFHLSTIWAACLKATTECSNLNGSTCSKVCSYYCCCKGYHTSIKHAGKNARLWHIKKIT